MLHYNQKKYIYTFFITMLCSVNILCMESFVPAYIGNYRIQSSKERNTIITDLERVCPELIGETLVQIMQPNSVNRNTVAIVRSIHNDLGINQSIFLMQLIHNLALKTKQNSSKIVEFINKQRKIYICKDQVGNENKTANFFAAFNDAKIVFYFLAPIQNKILNNESLTKNEYNYLLKSMHLMDWQFSNSHVAFTRPFFERFHESVAYHHGGYWQNFKYVAVSLTLATIDTLTNFDDITKILLFLNTVSALLHIIPPSVTATHLPPRQITIPFKQNNETVSIEDMDTIIEHTPWLD